MLNAILIVLLLVAAGVGIWMWLKKPRTELLEDAYVRFDFSQILKFTKEAFREVVNADPYEGGPSAEEYEKRKNRRKELRKALRNCMHGDSGAKLFVKSHIRSFLLEAYGLNAGNIDRIIPFDQPEKMSDQDRFDVVLYHYQYNKGLRKEAFNTLVKEFQLDQIKRYEDGDKRYVITVEEIRQIYKKLKPKLSFEEKLDIVVQRVYQSYKGHGVIDELRDQNIDGVSGGVSGVPEDVIRSMDAVEFEDMIRDLPRAHNAVWVFYEGKSIQLEFLGFGSEQELKRVCQNIYTYGNVGQLNEAKGYMVNDMADGSRVLVLRPKLAETWVFFVRKHNSAIVSLEKQVRGKNAQLVVQMLTFLMFGKQTTVITGPQGSGKTTLIKAMLKYVRAKNIRIQETIFELQGRKLYPNKNIVSLRETPTNSAQEGMDIQKKSDGAVNIIGEAATHAVVSLAIQAGLVGSEFTVISHHGMTFENLINALRNSLVANGDFDNQKDAGEQVVSWLGWNVHILLDGNGKRYIERITQCIPVSQEAEYKFERKSGGLEEKFEQFVQVFTEYAQRSTDRKQYEHSDVIVWEEGEYKVNNNITDEKVAEMRKNMDEQERAEFDAFLQQWWRNAA